VTKKKEVKKKRKSPVKKIDKYLAKLDQEMVDFITAKVEELGSIEEVALFYCLDDSVSGYANELAKKISKKKKG